MRISQKTLCSLAFAITALYVPSSYAIDQTKVSFDITTRAFGRSLDFTSDTTTSTRDKFKLVLAAKSDAAAYVATDGHIEGPYLTKALLLLREQYPEAQSVSDLELAQAILAIK